MRAVIIVLGPIDYQGFLDSGCWVWACETEFVELVGCLVILRRISMAGLSSRTVPHLADAIHAAVVGAQSKV